MEFQDWIKSLCHDTAEITISIVVSTPTNRLGMACDSVWIPYHDEVDNINPNLYINIYISKDPNKEALGFSWNSGQDLLY